MRVLQYQQFFFRTREHVIVIPACTEHLVEDRCLHQQPHVPRPYTCTTQRPCSVRSLRQAFNVCNTRTNIPLKANEFGSRAATFRPQCTCMCSTVLYTQVHGSEIQNIKAHKPSERCTYVNIQHTRHCPSMCGGTITAHAARTKY